MNDVTTNSKGNCFDIFEYIARFSIVDNFDTTILSDSLNIIPDINANVNGNEYFIISLMYLLFKVNFILGIKFFILICNIIICKIYN